MSNVVERSTRSILVGNLPSEISEEILRELFAEFGSVVTLKCFKEGSSGFAFCEYEEQEMAHRAIHSLSNYEYQGKSLKVDIASSEKSKEELESLYASIIASPFEASDGSSEKAPEEISKAVASLPAEQMFELMKQMKMCIENNPQEARNLLLQNPQLAFALLQAQVIMRIVDPEVALKILNRPEPEISEPEVKTEPAPVAVADNAMDTTPILDQDMRQVTPMEGVMHSSFGSGDKDMRVPAGDSDMRTMMMPSGVMDKLPFDPRFRGNDPRIASADPRSARQMQDPRSASVNPRPVDPRMMPVPDPRIMPGGLNDPRVLTSDPRAMSVPDPRVMPVTDPRVMPVTDPRGMSVPDPRISAVDPRMTSAADPRIMPGGDPRVMPGVDPRAMRADPRIMQGGVDPRMIQGSDPRIQSSDPRSLVAGMDPRADPRTARGPGVSRMPSVSTPTASGVPLSGPRQPPSTAPPSSSTEDEEKAALIMQVLQLSDEQIALLPPDQRQSIIVLKEQIARSHLHL